MFKLIIFCGLIFFSTLYSQNIVEFKIIGKDDGKRTTRDKDYNEALIDAKRKALEKAGVKIKSETQVLNFQVIKDFVESKSEGLILPGMEIFDLGYDENNYYKVMIIGKLKLPGETKMHKKLRYVKLLVEKGNKDKAYTEIENIINNSTDDDLLEQALFYKIKFNLPKQKKLNEEAFRHGYRRYESTNENERYKELVDTYYKLLAYFPNSKYKEIAQLELMKLKPIKLIFFVRSLSKIESMTHMKNNKGYDWYGYNGIIYLNIDKDLIIQGSYKNLKEYLRKYTSWSRYCTPSVNIIKHKTYDFLEILNFAYDLWYDESYYWSNVYDGGDIIDLSSSRIPINDYLKIYYRPEYNLLYKLVKLNDDEEYVIATITNANELIREEEIIVKTPITDFSTVISSSFYGLVLIFEITDNYDIELKEILPIEYSSDEKYRVINKNN